MTDTQFIHLRVLSDYSLGKGAIKINSLIGECVKRDMPAVALTDSNTLSGSLEFSNSAVKEGIQPIIGLDQTVSFERNQHANLLLIAKDEQGYKNLLKISSISYLETHQNFPEISLQFITDNSNGLISLVGGYNSYERQLFKEKRTELIESHLVKLQKIFGDDLYIELNRFEDASAEDMAYEECMLGIAYTHSIKLVATNNACFLTPDMHSAHDVLTCISTGRYLIEDNRTQTPSSFYFKSSKEMISLFSDLPEAIEHTVEIAKKCTVFSENHQPLLPSFVSGGGDEGLELCKQAREGLKERLKTITTGIDHKEYLDRLEYELSVIEKMKYPGYFLIVSDFIKWSKANNIPVGPGRGSGAGSVVAWALKITDLDPLQYGLLFERFLNPDRVSMPDFDIDFCQEKRERVIKYVQEKYGKDQVSQIITFGKLQARAVLRDVGRVMHIPYGAIDKICKMVPNNPANPVTLGQAIALDKELQKSRDNDPEIKKLLNISLKLEGLNRHSSTHAAGIVIADRPIMEIAPLYKEPTSEMPAVQFSMKYAESAGLVKFDFLGLKTLTVIDWTSNYIREHTPDFDIQKVSLKDEPTYKLLSDAKTIGVFQFESSGMKEAIKKLKPDAVEDLIALGALYRPGPMDNIPSYINRKHGKEKPTYIHEKLEPILRETYGIIVYQEQVMEIPKQLASYSLGQADLLRRAMGKKIKSEMEAQRTVFYEGCAKNSIPKEQAVEIFNLIEKFASYGFNKSHAAAYAIISYQTAYLKANYTKEFFTASINLEINDTDKINLFIEDAKSFKIPINPPCVNKSQALFAIEEDAIRYGLAGLKNVGKKISDVICQERTENGEYKSLFDFVERLADKGINKRLLESLAKSGTLDSLFSNRKQILENIELLVKYASGLVNKQDSRQIGLFLDDEGPGQGPLPELIQCEDFNSHEKANAEFESIGFYLSAHPLESYKDELANFNLTSSNAVEAIDSATGRKIKIAGVITSRKIRSSPRGKYAFLQLSDLSGLIETSIFNESMLIEHEDLINPGNVVFIHAEAKRDEKGLRVIIDRIQDIKDAVGSVNLYYKVEISTFEELRDLTELESKDSKGVVISPTIMVNNKHRVFLRSKKPFRISKENVTKLRDKFKVSMVSNGG